MGIYKQCSAFELFDSVQKTPYGAPLKILTPRGPPRASKYPKMGVGSIVWGIFLHVYFLYNFWEFLQFFSELCDTQGPLGGLQGPRGGPPTGVPIWGTPLGGPPGAPPGVPRCQRVLEKIAKNLKLYRKFTCIKIPQI